MLFKERFPSKAVEVVVSFPEALETLRQNDDESLKSYYQRVIQITSRYGVRDRLPGSLPLSILESSTLDLVYGVFLRGLKDRELRYEAIRMNAAGERSLYTAFGVMEEAYKSRLFLKKLEYKESQTREITFYKNVVKRNVSASQLESMLATYKAKKDVSKQGSPQQLQLPPPEPSQSQQSRPSIQSKSISWSINPPGARRAILKPGSGYGYGTVSAGSLVASAAGYGPSAVTEAGNVVGAGSVTASAGGPAPDQGVG